MVVTSRYPVDLGGMSVACGGVKGRRNRTILAGLAIRKAGKDGVHLLYESFFVGRIVFVDGW